MKEDKDYATEVTHLRIFDEGDGWALDAADDEGNYSEAVWKYDSMQEALAAAPEFVEALPDYGVTMNWRKRAAR